MRLPLFLVDAFATRPFEGNPAAVVPLPRWLPDPVLQAMAAEHNLSETAFLVAGPEGWQLRWFTPRQEVPLCGHATLASAFVLATEMGEESPLRFHTASGLLGVAQEEGRFVLEFPAWAPVPVAAPPGLVEALGATPRAVWKARDWICLFDSPDEVLALRPDHARIAALPDGEPAPGVPPQPARVAATAPGAGWRGSEYDAVSRYFSAKVGAAEDPVTGAAHTQLVPFWADRLGRERLVCRQASARGGTLWCERRGDRVRLGGHAVLYGRGEVRVPG
ncbi:PhzF family phenazine biosynthesis protein [Roseomonas sp. NAR14]|uniref:PhzF family phenazine biosynthesis protein n=1 Tax=Roseomonas acroporae TaxID=2937791 RepID=A0A9X1YGU3_9PROT|nr:PhzF family phenazine biosynthesis protein [Roseomonas acroporae]MCK8786016.1 PhzF family phenazine biosynthesis protein [Roseomonas acroporae]